MLTTHQAFYLPNKDRQNLTVLVEALVSRIITKDSDAGLVAEGVEFIHHGKTYTANAKEVIVCAGYVPS